MKRIIRRLLQGLLSVGTSATGYGPHVTRYAMYRELASISEARGRRGRVLAISHSKRLVEVLGIEPTDIVEAIYPEHSATDLSAWADASFDFIVSDQVLEHVEGNPQSVFDETWRLLKPGGIAVHTTCFIHPFHPAPSDFWRFSVEGLRFLARQFEIINAGGFGNRMIWIVDYLNLRWSPVPNAKWHPLHKIATSNNPEWPVVTWIVVRKP